MEYIDTGELCEEKYLDITHTHSEGNILGIHSGNFESMFIKDGVSETRKGLEPKKQQERAWVGQLWLTGKLEKRGPWVRELTQMSCFCPLLLWL